MGVFEYKPLLAKANFGHGEIRVSPNFGHIKGPFGWALGVTFASQKSKAQSKGLTTF